MTVSLDIPAPYFFLSYAPSDPLAGNPDEDPNKQIETFFDDLSAAVKRYASAGSRDVGFFDRKIPRGADWKQSITGALSAAQVFVPLYSVGYLKKSWPGRELTCFTKRVAEAGGRNPIGRLVPVLWAPLAGVKDPPGLREAVDRVTEPDYADNGLCALLTLEPYRDLYEDVVDRMGAQIVEIAESDPIDPVEPEIVGDIEKAPSAFEAARRQLPVFFIQVAAPTTATAPAGRDLRGYGDASVDWHPFSEQQGSLADYARLVSERFDFDVRVTELGSAGDLARRRPGIIVIDPSFIATEAGRAALAAAAAKLPRWVLPLVVVDDPNDAVTRNHARGVFDILAKAGALPTESARTAARGVESLDAFESIVPRLVAEAGKQYLRSRSSRVLSPSPARRPRLGQPEGPGGPPTAQKP